MKKIITTLTALTMMLSMAMSVNATELENTDITTIPVTEEDSQEDMGTWIKFPPYLRYNGVYYDASSIDGNFYSYNLETGIGGKTCLWCYDRVKIDGEEYIRQLDVDFYPEEVYKYTPIEEVIATLPVLEYTILDLISVQKHLEGNFKIDLEATPYYDYDADGKVNAVDLSLIKYELLH
jgi:hypothetical protein